MINLQEVIDGIHEPLAEYIGIEKDRLLQGNYNHPEEKLKFPRIVYYFTLPQAMEPGHMISVQGDTESIEEGFDRDATYTHIERPTGTLSVSGYGEPVVSEIENMLLKGREWFKIPELGRNLLKYEYNVIVRRVENIQDRSVQMEWGFQARWGFDVICGFEDVVGVRLRTIEDVEFK